MNYSLNVSLVQVRVLLTSRCERQSVMPIAFVILPFGVPLRCSCRLGTLHHQYLTLLLPSFSTTRLKLLSVVCAGLQPQPNHSRVSAVPTKARVQHRLKEELLKEEMELPQTQQTQSPLSAPCPECL